MLIKSAPGQTNERQNQYATGRKERTTRQGRSRLMFALALCARIGNPQVGRRQMSVNTRDVSDKTIPFRRYGFYVLTVKLFVAISRG